MKTLDNFIAFLYDDGSRRPERHLLTGSQFIRNRLTARITEREGSADNRLRS